MVHRASGPTKTVDSRSSTMAGPLTVAPGFEAVAVEHRAIDESSFLSEEYRTLALDPFPFGSSIRK